MGTHSLTAGFYLTAGGACRCAVDLTLLRSTVATATQPTDRHTPGRALCTCVGWRVRRAIKK